MDTIVVADDFTGAAEIAALAFEQSLPVQLARVAPEESPALESCADRCILVLDTNSRLMSAGDAIRAVRDLLAFAEPPAHRGMLFKKTDSALRGNPLVEIETLAEISDRKRVILAPANPTLGRRIENRIYTIDGLPISQTEFARDPSVGAASDDPVALLGQPLRLPIHYRRVGEALPDEGIVLCETASVADMEHWASIVASDDLPAGGGDFFRALLRRRFASQPPGRPAATLPGHSVFLQGSRSAQASALPSALPRGSYELIAVSPSRFLGATREVEALLEQCVESVRSTVERAKIPIVAIVDDGADSDALPIRIQAFFGRLAQLLISSNITEHFLIEGGSTAGSVLQALNCHRFEVVHAWAPGVATLASLQSSPSIAFTTKPGSYAWPANLLSALRSARPAPLS